MTLPMTTVVTVPDHWRWIDVRTSGCRAPIYDGPLSLDTFYCVKCDRPISEHPLDANTSMRWYMVPLGQTDEHSALLEIMAP